MRTDALRLLDGGLFARKGEALPTIPTAAADRPAVPRYGPATTVDLHLLSRPTPVRRTAAGARVPRPRRRQLTVRLGLPEFLGLAELRTRGESTYQALLEESVRRFLERRPPKT